MSDTETKTTRIIWHGQIATMTFPPGWIEGPPHEFRGGVGTKSFREVHPVDAPNASMCFYFRGLPASEAAGQSFQAVLAQPAHVLTADEINSLDEILRGKGSAQEFQVGAVQTEDLNGKRLLAVQGRWLERQEDVLAIYVSADNSGRLVQEIYFQAPVHLYARYLPEAQQAMRSIKWK